MLKSKVFFLLLLSVNTFANDVVAIKKGDPAPFDGFVITHQQEQKFRLLNENNRRLMELSDLQNEKINILDQRIKIRDAHVEDMSKELTERRSDGTFSKIFYFVLGAAVTTGVAYSVSRVIK